MIHTDLFWACGPAVAYRDAERNGSPKHGDRSWALLKHLEHLGRSSGELTQSSETEESRATSSRQRVPVRLSRISRFLWAIELTLIRHIVYGNVQGQFSGKGIELPGCETLKGFWFSRAVGALRCVNPLSTATRATRRARNVVALALLGPPLPDPPERTVITSTAAAIVPRVGCYPPTFAVDRVAAMERIAL